jgi:glutaminyl-peptide cyclotransferase
MPLPSLSGKALTRRRALAGVSVALATLLVGLLMFPPWSGSAQPPDEPSPEGPSEFASDRLPDPLLMAFDRDRAMKYLEAVCAIGPRVSGSAGMDKQQELLEKHFKEHGGKVVWQKFTARQRSTRRLVNLANLIVSWHPERPRRVVLCSHYDTRPIADREPDPRDWRKPFLSANDGGSGVALLMELAHHVRDVKTKVGIDFVFFDGEEFIDDPKKDEYFLGSRHFAQQYRHGLATSKTRYVAAVLLDMVAGKGARFPIEQNSWWRAGLLTRSVWGVAAKLGSPVFVADRFSRVPVEDDHVPLNDNGIPAIDIIDFDYPHWHRLSDTPANCSGATMEQVARVLLLWLGEVK